MAKLKGMIYCGIILVPGTHWIWEIVSMVTSMTADYDERPKETLMLEFQ